MPTSDVDDTNPDDLTGPLMLTPRRPEEVPAGREMSTLLDDFHHVHWPLLQQRHGLADPVPADRLVSIGLAELALGAALIDRLQALRWQTVVDVLAAGGSLTECAAAMGLAEEPPETVSTRLAAWVTAGTAFLVRPRTVRRTLRPDGVPDQRQHTRAGQGEATELGRQRPRGKGADRDDSGPGQTEKGQGRGGRQPSPPATRRAGPARVPARADRTAVSATEEGEDAVPAAAGGARQHAATALTSPEVFRHRAAVPDQGADAVGVVDAPQREVHTAAVVALSELVRAERVAFLELLETLTPQEWGCPSLCGAWTVQEVAAHLAVAPTAPPWHTLALVIRYRSVNRANEETARAWARRGREAILAQLRANAADGARPFGVPPVLALADAVVHGLDVRRPLGRSRAVPPEALVRVADATLGLRGPLTVGVGGSPRKRVRGVRIVAEGIDWSHGEGPEVRGSLEALILLLNGRPVGRDELAGPGAPAVLARLR